MDIFKIIQVVLFFLIPFLLLKFQNRFKIIKTIGPILFCYAIGIVWANSGLPLDFELSDIISSVLIPIAIALILFNSDFMTIKKDIRKTGLSFLVLSVSILLVSTASVFIFKAIEENTKIASMLVGCYTGGTPNLFAIGYGLNASKNTIVAVNIADQIVGGVYFLFIVTLAKPILSKLSKKFPKVYQNQESENKDEAFTEVKLETKEKIKKGIPIFLLALGILAIGVGFSFLLTKEATNAAIIMLCVSVISVVFSFVKKVRKNPVSYNLGQYFVYVFSLAVGSMADLKNIIGQSLPIFGMVFFVIFATVIVHFLIATLFKIDPDTVIITSVAGIFSPAFVIPTAKAIKNESIILVGIATGLLGYAVGNFLGFGLFKVLELIVG